MALVKAAKVSKPVSWCSFRHCVSQHTCFSACTHTQTEIHAKFKLSIAVCFDLHENSVSIWNCNGQCWACHVLPVKKFDVAIFLLNPVKVWKYEILHGATAYWAWALHVHAMSFALTLFQGHSNRRQFYWWFCFLIHLSSNSVSWLLITSCRWLTYLQFKK